MKQFYMLLCMALLLVTCKRNKEPNPCEAIRNEPEGFKVEEFIYDNDGGREDIVFETADTVCESLIRFTSRRAYDSYEWQIGTEAEPRLGNPIGVIFNSNHVGKIPIMLVGKRKPQPDCIPNDDGIDTFRRNIVVVLKDSSRMYGRYHGYNTDNPKDTFTIQVKKLPRESKSPYRNRPSLYNLPNGCMMKSFESSIFDTPIVMVPIILPKLYLAYNGFYSDEMGASNWRPICGIREGSSGLLSNNNQTITIKYTEFYEGDDGKTKNVDKVFIGARVK